MKDIQEQIKYIDNIILPMYGFNNIVDYETMISKNDIDDNVIEKLNNQLTKIKEIFPVKDFNLHKYDNKFQTKTQSYNFLKTCLTISRIPYEIICKQKTKYLRLSEENIVLTKYIYNMQKSSEFRKIIDINKTKVIGELDKTSYTKIEQGIKSTNICKYVHYGKSINGKINITFEPFMRKNLSNIKIKVMNDNYDDILNRELVYEFNASGNKIFTNKITNGQSIFPERFIVPIELLCYCNINIIIELETEKDVICDIELETFILKKSIARLVPPLQKKRIQYPFLVNGKVLVIENGIFNVYNYQMDTNINTTETPLQKIKKYSVKNNLLLDPIEFMWNNFRGISVNNTENSGLIALICGYDMSVSRTHTFYPLKSIETVDERVCIYFQINKYGDTFFNLFILSSIELSMPNFYLSDNNKRLLRHNLICDNGIYHYDLGISLENQINLIKNRLVNTYIIVEFICTIEKSKEYLDNITLLGDYIFYEDDIRRQLVDKYYLNKEDEYERDHDHDKIRRQLVDKYYLNKEDEYKRDHDHDNILIEYPDFIIYDTCYESLPCQHKVVHHNVESLWSAPDIISYLQQNNLPVPDHLNYIIKNKN